jgi:hypothetical protein
LLANLHKDQWLKYVEARIEKLSPALKDRILSCFKVLHDRHRFVRHPRKETGKPIIDTDWLDLALKSHAKIPFYGIILSQALMRSCGQNNTAFIELSEALDSSLWRGRRRTLTIKKREEDYRAALTPILRYATALTLIDPYLNSHESRFFSTVQVCSELMGKRGHAPLPGRIHIHAEMKRQKPEGGSLNDYLDSWEKKLHPLKSKNKHKFKIFLWESLSETLHDRFILTDQCGVGVQGGLDCRTQSVANDTVWSLLEEEDRRTWLEKFTPKTSSYKLLDEREVL